MSSRFLDFESDEQAHDFSRRYTTPGTRIPQDDEIPGLVTSYMKAVSMHRLKLAGMVWFEGEFPITPGYTVDVVVNDTGDKEYEQSAIREVHGKYKGASRSRLIAICRSVEKPAWAE